MAYTCTWLLLRFLAAQVEYKCVPCGCVAFCKGCAMKLATGGRCKLCGEMYSELKRLAPPS